MAEEKTGQEIWYKIMYSSEMLMCKHGYIVMVPLRVSGGD